MPGIDVSLTKIVIGGTLASGVQGFSTSLWIEDNLPDTITQATYDEFCASVQETVVAFLDTQAVTRFLTTVDQFEKVTYYHYFSSLTSDIMSEQPLTTPIVGNGTGTHPKETSVVVSLRSQVPGRSGRGRMYLPATGIVIGGNGLMGTGTNIADLASGFADWMQAIIDLPAQPTVASFTKSQSRPLVEVIVDNKPDTQRRRQDKVLATVRAIEPLVA